MSDVSVVCVTCDKYSRLIPGFCHFLAKYWPDRPWPLQIVAEREQPWFPTGVGYYYYGRDRGWSTNMCQFLDEVATEYIVLLLDDYYLSEPANGPLLSWLMSTMQEDKTIGYINLRPWGDDMLGGRDLVSWQQVGGKPNVGEYDKETAQYLLSLQPGLWAARRLRQLLRKGEDERQAEIVGTERARAVSFRMLGVLEFPLPYVNVTRYGEYRDGAREWLVDEIGEGHGIVEMVDEMLEERIH